MYILGDSIPAEVFAGLLIVLQKSLPNNIYRTNSGEGRSQCFGIVHQRNGTYTGSRMNFTRNDIFAELEKIANILPEDFSFLSIQVNENYQSLPHRDAGNRGLSCIVGFGDYVGGYLDISGIPVDIKHRLVYFDGSRHTHSTMPWTGNRYSLVFHTPDADFIDVPRYNVVYGVLEEEMDGVTRGFNEFGELLYASDEIYPARVPRQPTLRACKKPLLSTDGV